MCNDACIDFGAAHLLDGDVRGKRVIEVGSLNVNGSLRRIAEDLRPSSYLGVDIVDGPGVDEVCDALSLQARYGQDCFDVVISTEALEHIRDWRGAVSNIKKILRPRGILLLTTRSRGFPYHGYPVDFWRFELSDVEAIFEDLSIEVIQTDPSAPGVFVRCRKPESFSEKDLTAYELYSMVTRKRCRDVRALEMAAMRLKHALRRIVSAILPRAMKTYIKERSPRWSRFWGQ